MAADSEFEKQPVFDPATRPKRPDSGFSWGLAAFLATAVVFVIFVVQNPTDAPIRLFGADYLVPLPILLVTTALVAIIADEIFGWVRRRRRRQRRADIEELGRYRDQ